MKKLIVYILSSGFQLCLLMASSPSSEIAYVSTPQGMGANRFLVLTPNDQLNSKGSCRCMEVQLNGEFKELWRIPWYEPPGYACLHQDGISLLRVHSIDNHKARSRENYGMSSALSFYINGNLFKTVSVGEIMKTNESLEEFVNSYRLICKVESSLHFRISEIGFGADQVKIAKLFEESRFGESRYCVTTTERDKLYFTATGELICTVTSGKGYTFPAKE